MTQQIKLGRTLAIALAFMLTTTFVFAANMIQPANGKYAMPGNFVHPNQGPVMYEAEINGEIAKLTGFGHLPTGPYRWNKRLSAYVSGDGDWAVVFKDDGTWYGAQVGGPVDCEGIYWKI
jgi:hypothetical protein